MTLTDSMFQEKEGERGLASIDKTTRRLPKKAQGTAYYIDQNNTDNTIINNIKPPENKNGKNND